MQSVLSSLRYILDIYKNASPVQKGLGLGISVTLTSLAIIARYLGRYKEDMRGKNVLLLGASSDIGEEIALSYARKGARLALASRREELLHRVAALCKRLGSPEVKVICTDVTNEEECKNVIDQTVDGLGGIDILVLNQAAVRVENRFEKYSDMKDMRHVFEVNFFGSVQITQYALPFLKKSKGQIAVISSIKAKRGMPNDSNTIASNCALHGFFNSLRLELINDGVSVSIVLLASLPKKIVNRLSSHESGGFDLDKLPPVVPSVVGRRVVKATEERQKEVVVAGILQRWLFTKIALFSPSTFDKIISTAAAASSSRSKQQATI